MYKFLQNVKMQLSAYFVDLHFLNGKTIHSIIDRSNLPMHAEISARFLNHGNNEIPLWLRFVYGKFLCEKFNKWFIAEKLNETWLPVESEFATVFIYLGKVYLIFKGFYTGTKNPEINVSGYLNVEISGHSDWWRLFQRNDLPKLEDLPVEQQLKLLLEPFQHRSAALTAARASQENFLERLWKRVTDFFKEGKYEANTEISATWDKEIFFKEILRTKEIGYSVSARKAEGGGREEGYYATTVSYGFAYGLFEMTGFDTLRYRWPDFANNLIKEKTLAVLNARPADSHRFSWESLQTMENPGIVLSERKLE